MFVDTPVTCSTCHRKWTCRCTATPCLFIDAECDDCALKRLDAAADADAAATERTSAMNTPVIPATWDADRQVWAVRVPGAFTARTASVVEAAAIAGEAAAHVDPFTTTAVEGAEVVR
jgi:hypothetical protein